MVRIPITTLLAIAIVFSPLSIPHAQTQRHQAEHKIAAEEIRNPANWVARGGCWDFSENGITAQAGHWGHHLIYYNKRVFSNFVFEVRLNKLAESGPFGLLVRYDEKKKEGYTYLLHPHGGYRLSKIRQEEEALVFGEPTVKMHSGTNVWNTIKIVCRGGTFELYMNDHLLTSVTDHTHAVGKVGLFLDGDPRQKAMFEIVTLGEL